MKFIIGRFLTLCCVAVAARRPALRRGATRGLQTFAVTELALIDVSSNQKMGTLNDGDVLDINSLSGGANVQALVTGAVGSVVFEWNGAPFKTESVAPYAFCGDASGFFGKCTELAAVGSYTIKATPYSMGQGMGTAGTSIFVSFTITDSPVPTLPPVPTTPLPTVAPVAPPPAAPLPWVETFDGLPDGAKTDNGPTAWTATRGAGLFEVKGGALMVNLGGTEGVLSTEAIGVANVAEVDVSLDLYTEATGDGMEAGDYVNLFVILDGGAETLLGGMTGLAPAPGTTLAATVDTSSATTLQVVVRAKVSWIDEWYYLDTLSVTSVGSPAPVTPVPTDIPTPAPSGFPTAAPVTGVPTFTIPPSEAPTTAVPSASPSKAPTKAPSTPTTFPLDGTWDLIGNQPFNKRHEACFAMVGDKAYLMGGRESSEVDIYNPSNGQWSSGTPIPNNLKLHHLQCTPVNGKVYFPAAWTGGYPEENTLDTMWVYDTVTDSWSEEEPMKLGRRRGSAAVVVDGTKLWVSHGNIGGHEQGNFATSYGYIDYYDTVAKVWHYGDEEGFPDAPNPRDHTGGALINGRICVAGGRVGGEADWPAVAPTDCFDPQTKSWSVEASIPTPRSGANYGQLCDGRLAIAGGERPGEPVVEVFDGESWTTMTDVNNKRHGSSLAVDCLRNKIYLAAGTLQGGSQDNLDTMEIYSATPPPPTISPAPTKSPTTLAPVAVPAMEGLQALRLIYTGEGPLNNKPIMNLSLDSVSVVNVLGLGLSSISFNIDVVVDPLVIGQVTFSNGRTEGTAPFAYCGDGGGDFYTCTEITAGLNSVTFTLKTDEGVTVSTGTVLFDVDEDGTDAPTVSPAPTSAPTTAAPTITPQPTPFKSCKIPEFVGAWEQLPGKYPEKVTEAQGTLVGNKLVLTGGFVGGIEKATLESYYLDLDNPYSEWVKLPTMPNPVGYNGDFDGTTHSPPVAIGNTYIQAGGLVGGAKPTHIAIDDVYKFDFDTMEWSKLPSLPKPIFGAGMVHEESTNELILSYGADDSKFDESLETYKLQLDNIEAGWQQTANPCPFEGNHMTALTAEDGLGNKRHFFMGGQVGGNENLGNQKDLEEYIPATDEWVTFADMPFGRGHASWSAEAISCGFILAGGTINANPRERTTDISYYDIETDTWTEAIGQLPNDPASPICEIYKDYLYCMPISGGNTGYRIKIIVPE